MINVKVGKNMTKYIPSIIKLKTQVYVEKSKIHARVHA